MPANAWISALVRSVVEQASMTGTTHAPTCPLTCPVTAPASAVVFTLVAHGAGAGVDDNFQAILAIGAAQVHRHNHAKKDRAPCLVYPPATLPRWRYRLLRPGDSSQSPKCRSGHWQSRKFISDICRARIASIRRSDVRSSQANLPAEQLVHHAVFDASGFGELLLKYDNLGVHVTENGANGGLLWQGRRCQRHDE